MFKQFHELTRFIPTMVGLKFILSEYCLKASANTLKQTQGTSNASLCLLSLDKLS